jgi:hypothetical protein
MIMTLAVNLPMLVVGLCLILLSLAALVVLGRRRRRAAVSVECEVAEPTVEDDVMEVLQVEESSYEVTAIAEMVQLLELNEATVGTESAIVRALRAQIRALEQALEIAPETGLAPAVTTTVDSSYRNQVLLAVRAVAARTTDADDPRHAAARVVAAVERLDADGFTRPVLPGLASRTVAAPPPLPPETAVVTPPPAAPELPAATEAAPVAILDDSMDEAEVVLPVPPPAPEEPKRTRRRLRRSAA